MKNVRLGVRLEIPYSDCSIGTPADKRVTFILESPHSTFVSVEALSKLTIGCVVDIDRVVIGRRNDLVRVELQASDHVCAETCKGCMSRSRVEPIAGRSMSTPIDVFERGGSMGSR